MIHFDDLIYDEQLTHMDFEGLTNLEKLYINIRDQAQNAIDLAECLKTIDKKVEANTLVRLYRHIILNLPFRAMMRNGRYKGYECGMPFNSDDVVLASVIRKSFAYLWLFENPREFCAPSIKLKDDMNKMMYLSLVNDKYILLKDLYKFKQRFIDTNMYDWV
jgi:hypothetical protein